METIDSLKGLQTILGKLTHFLKSIEDLSSADQYSWLKQEIQEAQMKLSDTSFYLGLLGEFKRGKSTLLSALAETGVIPMGVVPLTSIVTAVRYGEQARAEVIFKNGRRQDIDCEELVEFVTESKNPQNEKQVERVQLFLPREILKDGLVLLDTPGVGSFYEHNTELTYAWLSRLDAAFFLLSPDPPVSRSEIEFLRHVLRYVPRVFLVLNKIDRMDADSISEVIEFSKQTLQNSLGIRFEIHPISARKALEAKIRKNLTLLEESGLPELQAGLEDFLIDNKGKVFVTSMVQKTGRILENVFLSLQTQIDLSTTPLVELQNRVIQLERIQQNLEIRKAEISVLLRHQENELRKWLDHELDSFEKKIISDMNSRFTTFDLEQEGVQEVLSGWFRKEFEDRTFAALEFLEPRLQQNLNQALVPYANGFQEIAMKLVQDLRTIVALPFGIQIDNPELHPRGRFWIAVKDPLEHVTLSAYSYFTYLRKSSGKKRLLRTFSEAIEAQALACSGHLRQELGDRLDQSFRQFYSTFERSAASAIQSISAGIRRAIDLQAAESEERNAVAEAVNQKLIVIQRMREELSAYQQTV